MHQPVIVYVVVGGLMAWSVYRRTRRNIGRQKLQPRRAIIRLIFLCVASGFIVLAGLLFPRILVGFAGGALCGGLLGLLGLRLTSFETTEEGHFYTPDTRIGVALSLLLAARLIYRMVVLNDATMAPSHPPAMQSPLTFLIIGLTVGYYLVYSFGLFVHTHDKKPLPPASSV